MSSQDLSDGTITQLLDRARHGDDRARDTVFSRIYEDLRRVASNRLASARNDPMLETTGLVNSACERLLQKAALNAKNRRHLFYLLGRAMQDVLVDHIKAVNAKKRGGGLRRVDLPDMESSKAIRGIDISELRTALEELGKESADSAEMVVLRLYAGRSFRESAELMGCSLGVAKGHWDYALAWLRVRLAGGASNQVSRVKASGAHKRGRFSARPI